MKNILTTIPRKRFRDWAQAKLELEFSDGEQGGFWTVAATRLPKTECVGAQCYMIFDGLIRGYMDIVNVESADKFPYHKESCGGKATHVFVMANWHPIIPIPYTGFQGWRYTELKP